MRSFLLLLIFSALASAEVPDSLFAEPDSLHYYTLDVVEVHGEALRLPVNRSEVTLDAVRLQDAGGSSLADLGKLLPSTEVTLNSRGESLFQFRASPERHLPVYLEGIPLSLPWDERADLSMLPAMGLGEVRLTRGMDSALQGSGSLSGRVDLQLLRPGNPEDRSQGRLLGESGNSWELTASRRGKALLTAFSHRQRDYWPLSSKYEADFHQDSGQARNNSDLRQSSLLLHWPGTGKQSWSSLLLASLGQKGVPPETHREQVRFWRIPSHQRLILATTHRKGGTDYRSSLKLSLDFAGQEIRPYDSADFEDRELVAGDEYETGRDFTGIASWRIDREFPRDISVGLASSLRYARHKESLLWRGPWAANSQWLFSTALELRGEGRWSYRIGSGIELCGSPETGESPASKTLSAGIFHASLERETRLGSFSLAASERSRFPSMRERFSSALGKFEPNPDLGPETQSLLSLDYSGRKSRAEYSLTAFASLLENGIEKTPFPGDADFQRVNRDRIRVLGLEFMLGWRPLAGFHLGIQHSLYRARTLDEGMETPSEDRPESLSQLSLAWTRPSGLRLRINVGRSGRRHCSHPEEGLVMIPAQESLTLRLGQIVRMMEREGELWLKADNALDSSLLSRPGLPETGRSIQVGARISF